MSPLACMVQSLCPPSSPGTGCSHLLTATPPLHTCPAIASPLFHACPPLPLLPALYGHPSHPWPPLPIPFAHACPSFPLLPPFCLLTPAPYALCPLPPTPPVVIGHTLSQACPATFFCPHLKHLRTPTRHPTGLLPRLEVRSLALPVASYGSAGEKLSTLTRTHACTHPSA